MPPFYQAVTVRHDRCIGSTDIYVGTIDPEWTVASVPNGGYVLALILDACMKQQVSTAHPDPIHVTAHFLSATALSSFEIHVKIIKTGRTFTNIQADFMQNGNTGISSHLIFGVLQPPQAKGSGKQPNLTLSPPSPYARRVPLHRHPSNAPIDNNWHSIYNFRSRINTTVEPEIEASIAPDSSTRTNSGTIGGGGIDWGTWCGFKDRNERLSTQSLAFFADIFTNGPMLLPDEDNNGTRKSWYPTIVMTLEFKFPIPPVIKGPRRSYSRIIFNK
ncbi:hypothetical protein D9758_011591 [Tetrapyrgos nigripes]|uniref:Acyl-CoA thioesterase-like N-terminal HotDog domain-containing protein n=1 Tax=Tetrapyrgos nigripes TaxID=182062 RepID=A0A8H5FQ04_9AGAR|nr:hypothetical protein D9758_011591 [Tetrapyrgos nigripes]